MKRFAPVLVAALLLAGAPGALAALELRLNASNASPQDQVIATVLDVPVSGCTFIVFYGAFRVEGNRVLLDGVTEGLPVLCRPSTVEDQSFLLPALAAGDYTVEVVVDGETVGSAPLQVRERTELFLWNQQVLVEVTWDDPRAGTGQGRAVPLTDDSGGFWFFEEENLEATVKVIDGRGLNGHFWVFVASMTDVGFTLGVRRLDDPCLHGDPVNPSCNLRTYVQEPGANRNFLDVEAFEPPAPAGGAS